MADKMREPSELLIISSRARKAKAAIDSLLPGVLMLKYSYESCSLQDIWGLIQEKAEARKFQNIAFLLHGSEKELFLTEIGAKRINLQTLVSDKQVQNFFGVLSRDILTDESRIDFLGCYAADHVDGGLIARELQLIVQCQVGVHRTLIGAEIDKEEKICVGHLFFDPDKLATNENDLLKPKAMRILTQPSRYKRAESNLLAVEKGLQYWIQVNKDKVKKLAGYEKLRTVGKGAFGAAVLFRKKDDGLLVIIKEINMMDLNAGERQMALNEVRVLATLDHPNIIGYYDSFEKDGVLMIEMEFADGGNLAELLAKKTSRDLKTANIFLTKDSLVKVGDFGISKMLSTRQGYAKTVLGTPYYISPEMCEGKIYDEKSDVWAMGCILYEMACLQRTFEGSNLPALVNKIMKGQFAPIRGPYTPLFKQLVRDLLQRDPEFRPSASEVLLSKLPSLMIQQENRYFDDMDLMDNENGSQQKLRSSRPLRSVLYYMKACESSINLTPIDLPPRSIIQQVSVSDTHIIALTLDGFAYTWGEGKKGQLGHGELENWRSKPLAVEALKGKAITKVAAGTGFSIFASDNGIVMTCGDGSFGVLGHGDWNSLSKPKLIEQLLSVDVVAIASGSEHAVVVGGQGDVYSWGRGSTGRLGHGSEEDVCAPKEVVLNTEEIYITDVRCGGDGTILISNEGDLYACGSNKFNKLGLDEAKGWFFSGEVENSLIPKRVTAVKHKVYDASLGPCHTIILTDMGQMITFGRNSEGQLGRGHTKSTRSLDQVKGMQLRIGATVSCGSTYTLICSVDNVLYFWGTRNISPDSRPTTQDAFKVSFKDADNGLMESSKSFMGQTHHSYSMSGHFSRGEKLVLKDVVLDPLEILAFYASPAQLERGHTIALDSIHCQNQNIFLSVKTTCPLAKVGPDEQNQGSPVLDMDENEDIPEENQEELDQDSSDSQQDFETSFIPEWLKAELEDAKESSHHKHGDRRRKRRKRSKHKSSRSKDSRRHADDEPRVVHEHQPIHKPRPKVEEINHPNFVSQPNQGNQEKALENKMMQKLEKQYERRQQEILLEAELAVRAREEVLNQEVLRLREELQEQRRKKEELIEDQSNKKFSGSNKCIVM